MEENTILFVYVGRYCLLITNNNVQSENNINSFNEYMEKGGMPEYLKNRFGIILRQLIDDILYRDIAVRHNIRNVYALRELTVFLISDIGKPISARQLTGLFGISAATTIIDYFGWLQNAYVFDFVPIFDYSVKKEGTIVTHNQTDLFETDGTTIKLIPAWKYSVSSF